MTPEEAESMMRLITAQAKRIKELEDEIRTLISAHDIDLRAMESARKDTRQSEWATSVRNG